MRGYKQLFGDIGLKKYIMSNHVTQYVIIR